jgi:glycosyltransferase involved in cell wall biosynthesis
MNRVDVMHLIDTLNAGGAERMAVNIVNLLPRNRYSPHLCTTRTEGPLAPLVKPDVGRCSLNRKQRFEWRALRMLVEYINAHQIKILHAHGTALFMAGLAARFAPYPKIVWHDHWGRHDIESRPAWLYRIATGQAHSVIAVNKNLAQWSRDQLRVPANRVSCIKNFVSNSLPNGETPDLPGTPGARIVCVANFRPQKDLMTLVRAMSLVVREFPAAHLLLVGDPSDKAYAEQIEELVAEEKLSRHVSFMGQRNDVTSILAACDIGVLSSASEGLPLSLLEYGGARLPAVATEVGECAEMLDHGRAGILVSPGAADQLATGLLLLLKSSEQRSIFGEALFQQVKQKYNAMNAIDEICRVYESVQMTTEK